MIYELKDLTINSIAKRYNFKNQDIPDYLRNKEVSSGSKVFKLEGDGIEIEEWGHLNTTFVETKGTEIFNLIIFPNDSENLPIFASEILIFGEKLYLAVIDIENTWKDKSQQDDLYSQLDDTYKKYDYLPHIQEIPDWAESYFSSKKIYIRPCNKDFIDDIKNIYEEYLDFYLDYVDKKLQKIKIEKNNNDVNIYKEHHAQNSPGHGYLSKIFGDDWTKDYLSLFMYKVR